MTTWWSRTILGVGITALVLIPLGALGVRAAMWDYTIGFAFFQLSGAVALLGIVGGIPGVVVARRRALSRDLWATVGGMAIAFAAALFLGMQLLRALTAPPIHNISTNLEDPPEFIEIVALRGEDANPLALDAQAVGPQQKAFYPWVEPLLLRATPREAFDKALEALRSMQLEIVAAHPERGLIEATATTFWFGFKDDVALRVQPYPQGAVIDVRSVSRVGLSDVGANANRIKEILRRISPESSPPT